MASREASAAPEAAGAGDGGAAGELPLLSWLPATAAALAWRLQCLDAALRYGEKQAQPAARDSLPGYHFLQRPTARGVVSGQPLGESAAPSSCRSS